MITQYKSKNQLFQRATVNPESGTTLGGGRLEGEGFVQMFLLPFVTWVILRITELRLEKNFQDHQVQLFICQIMVKLSAQMIP